MMVDPSTPRQLAGRSGNILIYEWHNYSRHSRIVGVIRVILMKIIIKATNTKLTPAIRQYLEDKIGGLEKFIKKIDPNTVEARAEVGMVTRGQSQGEIFRAEVNLNLNGRIIRAEQTAESLYAAIDLVKDELSDEIKSYKEKNLTKFLRGARSWKKFWQVSPFARFRSSKAGKIIKKK